MGDMLIPSHEEVAKWPEATVDYVAYLENSFHDHLEEIRQLREALQRDTPLLEVDAVVACMKRLTDDERAEIISHFCKHCGDLDPQCQCWNDE